MKYKYLSFAFIALFLSACASEEQALYDQKPAFYSYIFGDVYTDQIDKESHADVYATPASCQKTVTALLALKSLGPDFRFETKLYASRNDSAYQDVVIGFVGDPTLTSDDLVTLLSPLQGQTVQGAIYLDASHFKTTVHSANWMIYDLGHEFMPPVSAINIDGNLIELQVNVAPPGQLNQISTRSPFPIDAQVMTTDEPTEIKTAWVDHRIKVKGHIKANEELKPVKLSPLSLNPYTLDKVQRVMERLKIKGKVSIVKDASKLPKAMTEIASVRSKPLSEILPPALKISDNFVFDSIYLTMLHRFSKEAVVDDWAQGDAVMKALMAEHYKIDLDKALLVDGSGLSRYNRIQPRMLFEVLKKGYQDKDFLAALARPGEDKSTLKNRQELPGTLYGKTGGLLGVSCLCGYDIEDTEDPKVFVVMVSGFAPTAKELFTVIDPFIHRSVKE